MSLSQKTRERNRHLFDVWRSHGCSNANCPTDPEWLKAHPWGMDADHLDHTGKVECLSNMVLRYGTGRLLEELSKCQPLCKLCHADKTYHDRRNGIHK